MNRQAAAQERLRESMASDPTHFAIGPLDPDEIPSELRHLIPLAERWGIGDDIYRGTAVDAATDADLAELASCITPELEQAFHDWLAGPEAAGPTYSDAYVAFSFLRMARDEAGFTESPR